MMIGAWQVNSVPPSSQTKPFLFTCLESQLKKMPGRLINQSTGKGKVGGLKRRGSIRGYWVEDVPWEAKVTGASSSCLSLTVVLILPESLSIVID